MLTWARVRAEPGAGMSRTLINREVERNILHSTSGWGKTRAVPGDPKEGQGGKGKGREG
jgi:hypothetical protein